MIVFAITRKSDYKFVVAYPTSSTDKEIFINILLR